MDPKMPEASKTAEKSPDVQGSPRYHSTMPDIFFDDPNRPKMSDKEELHLIAAKHYVHFCLFDGQAFPSVSSLAKALEANDTSKNPNALKGVAPNFTCRELDNVYHAIKKAQDSPHRGRDPSLVRAVNEIRDRLLNPGCTPLQG